MIVGRLIPAGTGAAMAKLRKIATTRDEMIIAANANAEDTQQHVWFPQLPTAE